MSASPSDGPERVPPWQVFSGDDAPPPGPELAALLGEAVADLGQLDERSAPWRGVGGAAAGTRTRRTWS